jgi:hypothetical protein
MFFAPVGCHGLQFLQATVALPEQSGMAWEVAYFPLQLVAATVAVLEQSAIVKGNYYTVRLKF